MHRDDLVLLVSSCGTAGAVCTAGAALRMPEGTGLQPTALWSQPMVRVIVGRLLDRSETSWTSGARAGPAGTRVSPG
ncbi:MAG: hypothetical protein M0013_05450 [Actinomycetota bacterium]|nr:hypothetical protein [Actinomycetota bacterium]